jgi:DNA-binding NarL/FixJ family response regulator
VAAVEPRIAIVGGGGALAAEALTWALAGSGNRVVGAYPSANELVAAIRAEDLDLTAAIVYADEAVSAPAAVAEIRRAGPELKILLICDAASLAMVRTAINERAEGVVLTSDTTEELILALRHVLEGRAVMPAGWQAATFEPNTLLETLSAREREVLDLVAAGMSNREIAERLMISLNTVKFHLRMVYSQLGAHNRVQATQMMSRPQDRSTDGSHPVIGSLDGWEDPLSAG